MTRVLGIAVGVVVLLSPLPTGAQAPKIALPAVDVTVADIQAVLKTAPADAAADLPIRVADAGGYHVGVYVVNRPKVATPPAIYHETKVTEVYHMLKGAGTLVTGGTVVGPIVREAPGTTILSMLNNVRGTGIKGGVSRRIATGDVVVIPGYVPHWWSTVESDMTYLVIRPDPDKTLPLK
jgi:mannose-6-phosphate isomerase-like protein (cupin superfamily)